LIQSREGTTVYISFMVQFARTNSGGGKNLLTISTKNVDIPNLLKVKPYNNNNKAFKSQTSKTLKL